MKRVTETFIRLFCNKNGKEQLIINVILLEIRLLSWISESI